MIQLNLFDMKKDEIIAQLQLQLAKKQEIVDIVTKENETLHIKLNVAKEALITISEFTSADTDKWEDQGFIAASALFKINS